MTGDKVGFSADGSSEAIWILATCYDRVWGKTEFEEYPEAMMHRGSRKITLDRAFEVFVEALAALEGTLLRVFGAST